MPRLILHIGTHKTATTTIQRFFHKHRATLANRGVFYPDYALVGEAPHYAHLGMVNALSGQHKQFSRDLAERFFATVRERAADYDTTIISAEPFYRHVEDARGNGVERDPADYWSRRKAYISRIGDTLGPAEIVVVFRRQADYAQSLYQEHVKVTRYHGNFRQFLREFWYHFEFAQQARAWNAAFPGLKAIRFNDLTGSGDVTGAFCRLLDLPAEGLAPVTPANTALPVDLVVLKRMLHRTKTGKDVLRNRVEELAMRLPPDVAGMFEHRSFFASARELQAFQQGFVDDNERIRQFLLAPLPADQPVFPPVAADDLIFGDRIKPQVLAAMLDIGLDAA